jgi:endonuclease V-like protein UPF0215 family
MAHEQAPLSVGEFGRWSTRTDRMLEKIDNKLDDHGARISTLESTVKAQKQAEKQDTRKTASGWSAGIAGAIIMVLEILHRFGFLAHAAAEKAAK